MNRISISRACVPVLALAAATGVLTSCGDHDHDHPSAGGGHKHGSAHGGVLVELGEHQYQLDVLADPGTGTLKAWVMDGHAENFVRVALPALELTLQAGGQSRAISLEAQADAATGEAKGDTSLFLGQADWLKGVTNFQGSIPQMEIRGSKFENLKFAYPGTP